MRIIVIGGGEVGYSLAKDLLLSTTSSSSMPTPRAASVSVTSTSSSCTEAGPTPKCCGVPVSSIRMS